MNSITSGEPTPPINHSLLIDSAHNYNVLYLNATIAQHIITGKLDSIVYPIRLKPGIYIISDGISKLGSITLTTRPMRISSILYKTFSDTTTYPNPSVGWWDSVRTLYKHTIYSVDLSPKTDCGCDKQLTENVFSTEFKLLKQSWSDGALCHLLLKMPSVYIDYTSEECPLKNTVIKTTRENAPSMQWKTVGEISPWHKLNSRQSPCIIKLLDSGIANIKSDEKSYEMNIDFKGSILNESIKFIKLDNRTNEWNMERVIKTGV